MFVHKFIGCGKLSRKKETWEDIINRTGQDKLVELTIDRFLKLH